MEIKLFIHFHKLNFAPKLKAFSLLFWCIISINGKVFSQKRFLSDSVKKYQFHISTAMQYSFDNKNELANREVIKANRFMPVHEWHKKELIYLLKKKFNNEIYYLVVKLEFQGKGFSYSYLDTSLNKFASKKIKQKIDFNKVKWQCEYLNNRDYLLVNKLKEIEAIDQFTRNFQMNKLFQCFDSCFFYKIKLITISDSLYSKSFFVDVIKNKQLKVGSFGEQYFSFILIARHLLNNFENDTAILNLYKEFCENALHNFFITPDYYANIMDYCFNFIRDENGTRMPFNTFGEIVNYKEKIFINNPETIDRRREELGLLPMYIVIKNIDKLPSNYIEWKVKNDINK